MLPTPMAMAMLVPAERQHAGGMSWHCGRILGLATLWGRLATL